MLNLFCLADLKRYLLLSLYLAFLSQFYLQLTLTLPVFNLDVCSVKLLNGCFF